MGRNDATDLQIFDDHPLAFYFTPRCLQSLASAKIASFLWRHKMDDLNTWDRLTVSWFYDEKFSCGDLLPVPSTIRDLIDESINQMAERVESWVRNSRRDVFPGCEDYEVVRKCIDCIEVDDDDDTIVGKLLTSEKMTPTEKYRLACKFFRKDDIERLWSRVCRNTRITEVTFEDDEVVYYWNCLMEGIIPEIPGDPRDSIDLRMISYDYLFNTHAIGYFWDKLSAEERMSIVIKVFIRADKSEKMMLSLLPKLNNVLVRHVLSCIASEIITTLAPNINNSEYLSQIWIYFCDFADVDDLFNVLRQLFELAFLPGFLSTRSTFEEGFRISEALYELWILAPDPLQTYVLSNHVESIFEQLYDIQMVKLSTCYPRDMKFLLDLFARVDLSTRNRIWRESWYLLMIRAKPSYLERFLRLCFKTDEEIVRFKEEVMMNYNEIEYEVEEFMKFGYCAELTEYINFCSSDKQRVENLRRRIIASDLLVKSLLDRSILLTYLKFIDDTFESIELANRFKEEFAMSPDSKMLKYVYAKLDVGCLDNLINIRYFLFSECRTNEVKQECLNRCRECLINTKFLNFEVDVWREFITWCTGSRENWWAFRRSLPVTQIFDKLIAKVIKGFSHLSTANAAQVRHFETIRPTYEILLSFTPLDNFLIWCYVTKEIVHNYKVNTLKKGTCRTLRIVLQKNWGKIVDIVLMWVFDDNVKQLDEFKATLKLEEGAANA